MRRHLRALTVLCMVCVSLILTYTLQISEVRTFTQPTERGASSVHLKKNRQEHRVPPRTSRNGRMSILILSSLGRSGSSFLADLVASVDGNIYFFEPARPIQRKDATKEVSLNETARYFHCDVRKNLFSLPNGKDTIRFRPSSKCSNGVPVKKNETAARLLCEQQKVLIIKTIRLRLSWIRELMDDDDLGLMVIHLVRDPRAIMLSMNDSSWGKSAEDNTCPFILQDLEYKLEMERFFPDRYFFLRYEDLCTNLRETATQIFTFLGVLDKNGADEENDTSEREQKLPACVEKFIETHTKKGNKDRFSTFRNTIDTYQRWRNHIGQGYLTHAETLCREVMSTLGYTFFETLDNARNFNISVLSDSNSYRP